MTSTTPCSVSKAISAVCSLVVTSQCISTANQSLLCSYGCTVFTFFVVVINIANPLMSRWLLCMHSTVLPEINRHSICHKLCIVHVALSVPIFPSSFNCHCQRRKSSSSPPLSICIVVSDVNHVNYVTPTKESVMI